jgi:hypothetical protein
MKTSLRQQIRDSMNLRDTEELLQIWQANDRIEWSDEAFEAIREILQSRDVEPPVQNAPCTEREEEEDIEDFTEEEIKIVDDDDPPDFYDPF